MNRTAVFITLLLTAACSRYVPPGPPAPRVVTPVSAPFERTWNAVIDVFAQEVITVETMEKASGFIVASRAAIPHYTAADSAAARAMADCGGLEPSLLGFRCGTSQRARRSREGKRGGTVAGVTPSG